MDMMSYREYRRRHGFRNDSALRQAYNQNVRTREGGEAFMAKYPDWRERVNAQPGYSGNPNFEKMDYRDFLRGRESTARLGALFRKNRGQELTPQMRQALTRQSAAAGGGTSGGGKPPAAPRAGGHTSPASVPMDKRKRRAMGGGGRGKMGGGGVPQ